jgi:hypothetical protein
MGSKNLPHRTARREWSASRQADRTLNLKQCEFQYSRVASPNMYNLRFKVNLKP